MRVRVHEAVRLDDISAANSTGSDGYSTNGAPSSNGAATAAATLKLHTSGNGSSNGRGKHAGNGVLGTIDDSQDAVAAGHLELAAVTGAAAVGRAANGAAPTAAARATSGSSSGNGRGGAFRADRDSLLNTIDEDQMAAAAGHLELAAVTGAAATAAAAGEAVEGAVAAAGAAAAGEAAARGAAVRSAAGTPYRSPGGRWAKFKAYSVWQRTFAIWAFAFAFAWRYFLLGKAWSYKGGRKGMTSDAVSRRKRELAVWLREGLVKLGPTFIKIGQQFSTRVDVLSPEFVKELEKLQDNVPPFDSATAMQILESNLGAPPHEVFAEFDSTPIAAASLGQVHLAKLESGERVVVKVQRPGLKELFDIDLKNIRALAVWLQAVDSGADGAARDWVSIYDECGRILYQEIDYVLEAENANEFQRNFRNLDWVKVPKVYRQYSTSEVLVLEYAPGVKVNDGAALERMGLDRQRVAKLAVESYLQQILRHGFFHADPHPGNVAVDSTGKLIYYDFGMMGRIPGDVRGGLMELFYGVYNLDADRCLDALIAMGVLVPTGERQAIRRTAQYLLTTFNQRLVAQREERKAKGAGYNANWSAEENKQEMERQKKLAIANIGEEILVAAAGQPFRFPATFTFVVRSFTVLDGIGKTLDPRFDMTELAAPYARELLLEAAPKFAQIAEDFKRRVANQNRAVANLFKSPNRLEDIGGVISRLESGDLKLRVRALEAERALQRVQAWQKVISSALVASTLVNVGTVLSVSAATTGAALCFAGAAAFGALLIASYLQVAQLEKRERLLAGAF